MRRWVALCFLLLIAFYLGAEGLDRCEDRPGGEAPICHILCNDGCATAPLPVPPVAPSSALPPPPRFLALGALDPLHRHPEPEKTPPRWPLA